MHVYVVYRLNGACCCVCVLVKTLTHLSHLLPLTKISDVGDALLHNMTSLVALNLTDNRIASLPNTTLPSLARLETLLLSNNKLSAFPTPTAPALAHLSVSNNAIVSWPRSFSTAFPDTLLSLNASGNTLASFPSAALALAAPHLNALHLSSCAISGTVPTLEFTQLMLLRLLPVPLLANVVLLQQLDVSGCSLTSFPAAQLANMTSLLQLDASNNMFTVLEASLFEYTRNLSSLSL